MARITTALASSVVALATAGAVAAPASAHTTHHPGGDRGGLSLTRSAAATLDKYDVDVDWSKNARTTGHDRGVTRLRGAIAFDGDRTTRWTKIRINERTHRVTAVVNGGDRVAVLRFRGSCSGGSDDRRGSHRTVLRLTRAGAASIDRAAGADAFDAGDAFAKAGRR